MSDKTNYESRSGKIDCDAEQLFNFVTDLRNFERFIPHGSVSNLKIELDSCSFQVSMLGTVTVRISETVKYSEVVYSGNALQINDFSLILIIRSKNDKESEVIVTLSAELNPFLKMLAAEPIRKFLETLINEMEKFKGWKETI